MFSNILHEGLRSSHLLHNRSVGRGNGAYFSEEKVKIRKANGSPHHTASANKARRRGTQSWHFLLLPQSLLRLRWVAAAAAAAAAAAKSLQSCPTLCDPRDGSPPGSPVPGILQARTQEWVAISFSNAGK